MFFVKYTFYFLHSGLFPCYWELVIIVFISIWKHRKSQKIYPEICIFQRTWSGNSYCSIVLFLYVILSMMKRCEKNYRRFEIPNLMSQSPLHMLLHQHSQMCNNIAVDKPQVLFTSSGIISRNAAILMYFVGHQRLVQFQVRILMVAKSSEAFTGWKT